MATWRVIGEVGIGVLFAVGAVFNALYTLRHGREFYQAWVGGAWHAPARWILRVVVVPNATAATVALIVFEAAVAVPILTQGALVRPALIAGAVFAVFAAALSSPGGTAGNLVLAAVQGVLAAAR